jgi:glycosyltransferase involved in cell wall biosynthesis
MINKNYRFIVVTPVYEDVEASSRLFREIFEEFGASVFLVAVDDGSVKQPLKIENLSNAGIEGVVLKLRRNVGHQRAISVGLGYISEHMQVDQNVVIMDSDGEDLPSTIQNLLNELESPEIDVAVAERKSRIETFKFKVFYSVYKYFFGLMTGRTISFGNFMALKFGAVTRLVAMQELSIHVASAVLASGLRRSVCRLDRGPRYQGRSKMNFTGLVLHGFKALMVFAEDVLVRVGITCAVISVFAVGGAMATIVLKVIGFSSPGWFSIALGVLVLMLLQTGALALMTLMLTGVMRGSAVTTVVAYQDFIEKVLETSEQRHVE